MKSPRSIVSERQDENDDRRRVHETTPLLAQDHVISESSKTLHHGKTPFYIWTVILGIVFLLVMCNGLIQAPQQRIIESVFCKYHYQTADPSKIRPDGEVDEIWCKISEVARPMAKLRGWFDFVGGIPGSILPIPFGILADRIGRKPVYLLATFGLFLEFLFLSSILFLHNVISIKFILLVPLMEFCGGGSAVAIATAYTMIADSIAPEDRAAIYFRVSGAASLGPLLAYPLAAVIMVRSPYLSMFLALILGFVSFLAGFALPETLNLEEARKHRQIAAAARAHLPRETPIQKLRAGILHLRDSTRELFHHHAVIWLMPMFLVAAATQVVMDFLMQYASEKFLWSFAKSSILPEIQTFFHVLLLMVVLPYVSRLMISAWNMTSARRDLLIVRLSLLVSFIGLVLIGLAPTMTLLIGALIIYSFGGAFVPGTRALLIGLVKPEQNARLFALAGTLTYFGSSISGPLLAGSYSWALGKGGFWLGAPFWVTAFLVALVATPLFILRFQGDDEDPLAITVATPQNGLDNADTLTLVSEELEEERERDRVGGFKPMDVW